MENQIYNQLLLAVSKLKKCILFRNNTGLGWVGCIIKQSPIEITLKNPRPLHAGLIKGSSDLIGWTSITIGPEHIGETFAVFTAIEVKSGKNKLSPEQSNFINRVIEAGGIAGVANDELDISNMIKIKTNGRHTTTQNKQPD